MYSFMVHTAHTPSTSQLSKAKGLIIHCCSGSEESSCLKIYKTSSCIFHTFLWLLDQDSFWDHILLKNIYLQILMVTSSSMTSPHTTRLFDTGVHKSKYQPVNGFSLPFGPQGHINGELLLRNKPQEMRFNASIAHRSQFNAHLQTKVR